MHRSGQNGDAGHRASLEDLRLEFSRDVEGDKRRAAETAYALAVRYRSEDVDGARRFDIAAEWARRALAILDALPCGSVEDVASTRQVVGGVPIPDLFHAAVVCERLNDLLF